MKRMFIRLDDACPKRDIARWDRMETLLDKYNIKPLVGIIPNCRDPNMNKYSEDTDFWNARVLSWQEKGWTLAMHGYEHVFETTQGGINPVNNRSEFAGLPFYEQCIKIREGISILRKHRVDPKVFFAPAHTFDENTLLALKKESNIRIISDTISNDCYYKYGFTFVPQQSGSVRNLPIKTITFCYHPNIMSNTDFEILNEYLKKHRFLDFPIDETKRRHSFYDKILCFIYFHRNMLKHVK